jgi:hypothetical protein
MSDRVLNDESLNAMLQQAKRWQTFGYPPCPRHQCATIWLCKHCDGCGYLKKDDKYILCNSCGGYCYSCNCRAQSKPVFNFPKGKILPSSHLTQ